MSDKKTTVRDLKTFIDAVEFASDQEEWVPSAKQWKRIRDMINSLEERPEQQVQMPQPYQVHQPQLSVPQAPPQFAPSAFTQVAPSGPAGYPQMPANLPPPQVNNPLFAGGGQMPVKTPDIDTGHGKPYQSSFAI